MCGTIVESLLYLESAPRYLDASQKILELFGNGFNEALKYIVIEVWMVGCIATHIRLDLRRNKKVGQLRICYEWQQL